MGTRAGLDRCGKSRPTGIRSPDLPARSQSLYRLIYPAHNNNNNNNNNNEANQYNIAIVNVDGEIGRNVKLDSNTSDS